MVGWVDRKMMAAALVRGPRQGESFPSPLLQPRSATASPQLATEEAMLQLPKGRSLSIHFWAQFKVLVLIYEALSGLRPSCFKDHISLYELAGVLRASGEAFLSVPPPSQVCLVEIRVKAFSVAAPRDSGTPCHWRSSFEILGV